MYMYRVYDPGSALLESNELLSSAFLLTTSRECDLHAPYASLDLNLRREANATEMIVNRHFAFTRQIKDLSTLIVDVTS